MLTDELKNEVIIGDYICMIGSCGIYDSAFFEYFKIKSIDRYDYEYYINVEYLDKSKTYKIKYNSNRQGFIKVNVTDEYIRLNYPVENQLLIDKSK